MQFLFNPNTTEEEKMATILGIAPVVGETPEFTRNQRELVMKLLGVTRYDASGKDVFLQLVVIEQREVVRKKDPSALGRFNPFPRTRKTKHLAWRFALGENNVFRSPRLVAVSKFPDTDFANPGILCLRWYRRNAPKHLG